jgi:hypothetical protein
VSLHRRLRRRPFITSEIYTKSWNQPDVRVALARESRAIPGLQCIQMSHVIFSMTEFRQENDFAINAVKQSRTDFCQMKVTLGLMLPPHSIPMGAESLVPE